MFLSLLAAAHAAPDAALVRQLSAYEAPPCEAVEAGLPDPVAALRQVVAEVELPPWAPMRAAQCLILGHPEQIAADLSRWVADPEALGLARTVWALAHLLPEELAQRVVTESLAGPNAREAAARLARSPEARIRAVAER